jgi:hypothetical protein
LFEKFLFVRHNLGFYNNVGSTATYHHPSSTTLLQDIVFHALSQVINQHPILSAIPLEENKKTIYFVRLPTIDLSKCVYFVERQTPIPREGETDEELDKILEEQHNKDFKDEIGSKPFWRLIILSSLSSTNSFSASWIFDHSLADGTSGFVFHHSFLAALRNIPSDLLNVDPVVEPPKTDLVPTLEDLHKLPLSFMYLAKVQWYEWFPKKQPRVWTGSLISFDPTKGATMRYKTIVLSAEATKQLLNLSRENKTTLTATMQCVIAASIFLNLDPARYDALHAGGTMSCRRFVDMPEQYGHIDDAIGTWVSPYSFEHKRRTVPQNAEKTNNVLNFFDWDEARSVRATITNEISKNLKDNVVNLLRWVPDLSALFYSRIGKKRTESFELSNVTAFNKGKAQSEDGWKVGRCVFSQCVAVPGPVIECSAVGGGDGTLSIGFTWLEGVVDNVWMESVMNGVREGLVGLTRKGYEIK